MQWTIDHILSATNGALLYAPPEASFTGVGIDSRTVGTDQLFVAIRGERHDGHTFVSQVVAAGGRGLVIESGSGTPFQHDRWRELGVACIEVKDTTRALGALAAFQRQRETIPVVAITGSNGKTSTRQMAALVVGRRYNALTTRGNFNNEIGLPLTLFQLSPAHEAAVLELGMNHCGEIRRLGAICRPTVGVITNVGPAHLEFLGTLEGVARAKGELIPQIDPAGTVILNRDDPYVAPLADAAGCNVIFFGSDPGAQVRAEAIAETDRGVDFDLVLPNARRAIALKTPGRFMVANALAAAAVGHVLGLEAEEIKAGLEAFQPVEGRLKVVQTARGVTIIDDTYNANPDSMAAAFDTLASLRKGRAGVIVLGDMFELGDAAERLHRDVGRRAAQTGPTRLYACGEFARAVAEGARSAGMDAACIVTEEKEAIAADLTERLTAGDWLLVKGSRGMAMETVVAAVKAWADETAG